VDGSYFIAAEGVSRTRAPGFREIDAMFAGATLIGQCALGFAWFKKSTDFSLSNVDGNTITFEQSASAFGFFARFWGLIEYLETNNQDGYQPGDDVILSFYPLSRLLPSIYWKPIVRTSVSTLLLLFFLCSACVYFVRSLHIELN
jgi:hypothetical protein